MAEERSVPQRRGKHAVPAQATQACETEHWAERLDLGSGSHPALPRLDPAERSEKQKEPKEGNWV